jgi:hypothetical protein
VANLSFSHSLSLVAAFCVPREKEKEREWKRSQ